MQSTHIRWWKVHTESHSLVAVQASVATGGDSSTTAGNKINDYLHFR